MCITKNLYAPQRVISFFCLGGFGGGRGGGRGGGFRGGRGGGGFRGGRGGGGGFRGECVVLTFQ